MSFDVDMKKPWWNAEINSFMAWYQKKLKITSSVFDITVM